MGGLSLKDKAFFMRHNEKLSYDVRNKSIINNSYSGIFGEFINKDGNVPKYSVVDLDGTDSKIIIEKISIDIDYRNTKVYAILAYPKKSGIYPGRLVLHGGGLNADSMFNYVRSYALDGYVAIAPDLPGIVSEEYAKGSNCEGDWTVDYDYLGCMFKSEIVDDAKKSSLYYAIMTALKTFHLLQDNEKVDINNIGVSGISWGGYMTTMLCGILGNQIKAAYAYYGTGHYKDGYFWSNGNYGYNAMDKKTEAVWIANYEAGNVAKYITCPFFEAAATNDDYFSPEMTQKTLSDMHGEINLLYSPNTKHAIKTLGTVGFASGSSEEEWFAYYLKNVGREMPKLLFKDIKVEENNCFISFNVPESSYKINFEAYYSFTSEGNWWDRDWKTIDGKSMILANDSLILKIALKEISDDMDIFISYTNNEKTYTVSSFVNRFEKHTSDLV